MPKILIIDDDATTIAQIQPALEACELLIATTEDAALVAMKQDIQVAVIKLTRSAHFDSFGITRRMQSTARRYSITFIALYHPESIKKAYTELSPYFESYFTFPVDLAAFKAAVQRGITAFDPITKLPAKIRVDEYISRMRRIAREFIRIDIYIHYFAEFSNHYDESVVHKFLMMTAYLFNDLEELEIEDYVGQLGNNHFVIITLLDQPEPLLEAIQTTFTQQVKQHYSPIDQERGYMVIIENGTEKPVPLMTLYIGLVNSRIHQFQDVREITELAAENRRGNTANDDLPPDTILTSW